jgi:serine protease Do
LAEGTRILAVDGKPIQRVGQFQRVIASYHPGDRVKLDVVRYGARRQFTVALTQAETDASTQRTAQAPPAAPDADGGTSKLGVAVQPLTGDVARQLGYGSSGGVVISALQPYGPAARAGLAEGTRILAVDGKPVNDVAAFRAAMAGKRAGDVVSLQVQSRVQGGGAQNSILNIRLPD